MSGIGRIVLVRGLAIGGWFALLAGTSLLFIRGRRAEDDVQIGLAILLLVGIVLLAAARALAALVNPSPPAGAATPAGSRRGPRG